MLKLSDLHDYQNDAVRWAAARTWGLLWLDLGLGKTVIAATVIKILLERYGFDRALVVAPKRVARLTWPDELMNWEHLKTLGYEIAVGGAQDVREAFAAKAPLTVTNYDRLKFVMENVRDLPEICFFDEHANLKNSRTKRVQAFLARKREFKRIFGMTATPAAESYEGLWSQAETVTLGRNPLGHNITAFRTRYFEHRILPNGGRTYKIRSKEAGEKIEKALAPMALAMKASDYISIEKAKHREIKVDWEDQDVRDLYDEMEHEFLVHIREDPIAALNVGAQLNKLRQICGGAIYDHDSKAHLVHTWKLQALGQALEDLGGRPALVFHEFRFEREMLARYLTEEGIPFEEFKSGLSNDKEREILRRWNAGLIRVLLLHPASAGEGLNLQHPCNSAIWYTLPWSFGRYKQACGRIDRQGQKEGCTFYRLAMEDSIDHLVWNKLQSKGSGLEALIEVVKSWRRIP